MRMAEYGLLEAAQQQILGLFTRYYDIYENFDDSEGALFQAEAQFHSTEQNYFMSKEINLGSAQAHEYFYFANCEQLDVSELDRLDEAAWQRGLSRVKPQKGHRSSDVGLIISAWEVSDEAKALVKKRKHYQSYRHTLWGWSHYKLIVKEVSTGQVFCNGQGRSLKALICKIN